MPEGLATYLFEAFITLARYLGFTISETPGHVSPPSAQCVALGILFDLDNNRVSLPEEKIRDLLQLLDDWSHREQATVRDLARLAGKLLYAGRVVRPGRTFLNRVLSEKRHATFAGTPIIHDKGFQADITWWRESLVHTNGISFLEFSPECEVSMDASSNGWHDGGPGLAGFNFATGEFFACGVPPLLRDWHIGDLELLCHLIVARLWGSSWKGLQVRGHTDNEPSYYLLQNGRSRVEIRLVMARTFATLQLEMEFLWDPAWIPTGDNILPDSLSRAGDPAYLKKFYLEAAKLGYQPRECQVLPWMLEIDAGPSRR